MKNVSNMSRLADEWNFSGRVALVPTMGALHDGHLALVREAAARADKVIVSIFVNPLQFGPNEDFEKYPRNLTGDAELLEAAGANLIFAPDAGDITPPDMEFSVDPGRLGDALCGKYRPGHFRGVSTIVMKLLQTTRPGLAIFGWKDAQQFLLLRAMTRDLGVPVALNAIETLREADGLAMSSRNSYLSPSERNAAPAIYRALQRIRMAWKEQGICDTAELLRMLKVEIGGESLLKLQYAEAVTMDSLTPIDTVLPGNTLIAVAAFAGETRLIDNIRL